MVSPTVTCLESWSFYDLLLLIAIAVVKKDRMTKTYFIKFIIIFRIVSLFLSAYSFDQLRYMNLRPKTDSQSIFELANL